MEISKMGSNVRLSLFEEGGFLSILRDPIGMLKPIILYFQERFTVCRKSNGSSNFSQCLFAYAVPHLHLFTSPRIVKQFLHELMVHNLSEAVLCAFLSFGHRSPSGSRFYHGPSRKRENS